MRGKDGAVEWTVGKLMAIVLAVVLLVIIVFGWNSGISPLIERASGMFDEVGLFFINLWGGGGSGSVECLEPIEVSIGGVGDGVLIECTNYCEVELGDGNELWFIDATPNRFKYNRKDDVMNGGHLEDEEQWYNLDENYLGLDIEKMSVARELYGAYDKAYGEYFDVHRMEYIGSIDLVERYEIVIYIRIGNRLYRWMEDVKSWEVCTKKVNSADVEYYCDWSEKGKWHVRDGDNWVYIGDQGKRFDYLGELIEGWAVGSDFRYSVDLATWVEEESPTLYLMQKERENVIESYEDDLRAEFLGLLEKYYIENDGFDVYVGDVISTINSPVVYIDNKVTNGKEDVRVRRSGYLSENVVEVFDSDIVSELRKMAFSNIVTGKVSDKDWEDLVKVNKLYEFFEETC